MKPDYIAYAGIGFDVVLYILLAPVALLGWLARKAGILLVLPAILTGCAPKCVIAGNVPVASAWGIGSLDGRLLLLCDDGILRSRKSTDK